jgi:hypothetical protein
VALSLLGGIVTGTWKQIGTRGSLWRSATAAVAAFGILSFGGVAGGALPLAAAGLMATWLIVIGDGFWTVFRPTDRPRS